MYRFHQSEGLGHVVVGANVEPLHPVFHIIFRREHQNGDVSGRLILAQTATDLKAIEIGQHHIEDDYVGIEPLRHIQRLISLSGAANQKTRVLHTEADDVGDRHLIIHNEHALLWLIALLIHRHSPQTLYHLNDTILTPCLRHFRRAIIDGAPLSSQGDSGSQRRTLSGY